VHVEERGAVEGKRGDFHQIANPENRMSRHHWYTHLDHGARKNINMTYG
jgi:hypothetical protein